MFVAVETQGMIFLIFGMIEYESYVFLTLAEPRGISLVEKAYEIPIETKGFLQDSYKNNRDSI